MKLCSIMEQCGGHLTTILLATLTYTSPFALFSRLSLFIYSQSCIRIILLVPSGSETPICYPLHSFVLHLAPAVSVLQPLKSGTLSLRLFECVPAMILSAINSRPTTSSSPSNRLSASSLAPQILLWLTIVRVYKLYLPTYMFICCVCCARLHRSAFYFLLGCLLAT